MPFSKNWALFRHAGDFAVKLGNFFQKYVQKRSHPLLGITYEIRANFE